MDKIGVIHGRFQMLHVGHMEYLLAGKERCEYLIIGIANPDPTLTKFNEANPHRSTSLANPLSFYERFQIIKGSLLEAGIKRDEFDIVPFPINYPEMLFNYAPLDAKYYMTIYDEWSREKYNMLRNLGCDIEVMWERTNAEKVTSGSEVRSLISKGEEWKHLVPNFTYEYITSNKIDLRIKKLYEVES